VDLQTLISPAIGFAVAWTYVSRVKTRRKNGEAIPRLRYRTACDAFANPQLNKLVDASRYFIWVGLVMFIALPSIYIGSEILSDTVFDVLFFTSMFVIGSRWIIFGAAQAFAEYAAPAPARNAASA
jgi:hypothetical protein